jgi:hypothetical protein
MADERQHIVSLAAYKLSYGGGSSPRHDIAPNTGRCDTHILNSKVNAQDGKAPKCDLLE